jgi:hypothetical protein
MKKFSCEKCKYSTNIKDCIQKHRLSIKHLTENTNKFVCKSCDKTYKTQSGLCHHKHRCKKEISDSSILLKLVDELKESNKELKESNKGLKESMDKVLLQNHQPTTTNNNININYFNMNLFLKEQCNEAVDMDNFVNHIVCEFGNIEDMMTDYVKGSMSILKNNWKQLPLNKRPMHYIEGEDPHQNIFHIRHKGEWMIDTELNFINHLNSEGPSENQTLYSAVKQLDEEKIAHIGSTYFMHDLYIKNYRKILDDVTNVDYKMQLFYEIMKLITLDTRLIEMQCSGCNKWKCRCD